MKGFIKFLFVCLCIALVVSSVVLIVRAWKVQWVTLHGWAYAVIVAASVAVLAMLRVLLERLLEFKTPRQKAELCVAWEKESEYREQYNQLKDAQEKQYKLELERLIEQKRIEIERKRKEIEINNDKFEKNIMSLRERKDALQKKIDNNSILCKDDVVFRKVYRLISYMESNRADTVKEALIYDDNKQEMEHRKQAEDKFRQQQKEIWEKSIKEQELQNDKISKQNEELNDLLKKANDTNEKLAEDVRRMRLLRDEEYYKT